MQTNATSPSHVVRFFIPRLGQWRRTPLSRSRVNPFAPVDNAFLVFLRIVFGAIMLVEVCRFFAYNWISNHYITPPFHFTYYGFSWVKPWAGNGMYVHFFVLGVLAACILVGFCYRIAATLFFLGFTYVFLLDQMRYLNHFYLISLFSGLLMLVPAERAFSVDAWLRPHLRSNRTPAWTLWLLRAQIGIVYFYGGIAKLGDDWLRGEPMRTSLALRPDFPLIGSFFSEEWMVYLFVLGGLLLDLLVVPFLLWERTRRYAFLATVAFHLLNAQLFKIGVFPWFMLCATLIFFPPDLPRRIIGFFRQPTPPRDRRRARGEVVPVTSAWSRREKALIVLLALYLGVQLLVPLRHLLYQGDVNWTEEGHRFSWRMMLRTKKASALFAVTDPASGQTWTVAPDQYLKPRPGQKLATQPDMILQFSHFLADEKRHQGYENVEVRALVMVSLNGRKPQLLIDPTVDLAKEPRSLLPARWIMPLTEPLPDRGSSRQTSDAGED